MTSNNIGKGNLLITYLFEGEHPDDNKLNLKNKLMLRQNYLGLLSTTLFEAPTIKQKNDTLIQKLETGIEKATKDVNYIAEVIKLISGYSRRQNILSLNASIEAARSGEAGK